MRKIIHIDMDAFYASVEQNDHPDLRGKPVAVGGRKEGGVVAAASYEARRFGVKSALSSRIAARLCPQLIFVKPRFDRYKEISNEIRAIFYEYTDLVEPLSLDEAYLDITHPKIGLKSATLIAIDIKKKIKERTGLIASAGISFNKFLAKIASDMDKPNGLYVVLPENAEVFIEKLPIKKIHGIGKVTAEKMKHAGIFTGKDLKAKTLDDLCLRYGKQGNYYYHVARGIDHRPILPDRKRKSISAENTFSHHLMTLSEIQSHLKPITEEVFRRYQLQSTQGRTISLKIKYGNFKQITRSISQKEVILNLSEIQVLIKSLLNENFLHEAGIRLLGIGISNLQFKKVANPQMSIEF